MKKICFITTIPLTLKSFVIKTAEYLHQNTDWDISFICDFDQEFAAQLPQYIHYYPIKMERGISISGFKAIFQMWKIFQREKFDLIQYSTPNASFYAAVAGKIAKIPARLYCQWGIAYVGFVGVKRKIFKFIEKIVCSFSLWIEPDSKSNLEFSWREALYAKYKGNVIWNGSACGVDLVKFNIENKEQYRKDIRTRYSISENAFVYGFVGRITKDKGVNELLNSFKTLCERDENIYLLMVGPNENDGTINQSLYDWSKQCDRVLYIGYTQEVEQYLSAMDCYILPSYREGFGMGVIEAEAMGVPVIVTDIPGPVDAMKNGVTGFIIKKADVESLKKTMEYVKQNTSEIELMGHASTEFARQNFEQGRFFREVLNERRRMLDEVEYKNRV